MFNDSHCGHYHSYIVFSQETLFNDSHFLHNHSYIVCSQDKVFNDSRFGHNHFYSLLTGYKSQMIVILFIIILYSMLTTIHVK